MKYDKCYDGQDDVITAMIKKEDMGLWKDKLIEGQSYIMHNFKIFKNKGQFRVYNHLFKLLFKGAIV